MENKNDSANELANLRQQEEMQLNPTAKASQLFETDIQKLLQELKVHQVELQMQNDELLRALYATKDAVNLYDFAPVGYFTLSQSGEIIRLNLSGAQMLGKDRSSLINSNFRFFISNETQPAFSVFLGNVFQRKAKELCEVVLILESNEPMYVQLNGTVTESGEECLLAAIDITERKLTEKALRESDFRFRKLLQDVPAVSVQGYAPDGTTQYWNQASERLYGYTASEAIGKNLVDLIIPPEMRFDVKQAIQWMAETGQPIPSSELTLMHKDGSSVSVFSSHTIVQVPGHPQELFCIDIDLSERKEAEQALKESEIKYRELIENSPDAIGIYVEDKIVLVNKECLHLLAANSADELIGKPVSQFVHPDFRVIVQQRMQKSVHERIVLPLTEEKFIRLDGSFVDVEVKAMPIRFGNKSGVQLIVRDISERKKAEKILKESEERYRMLFENSLTGILMTHPDGAILAANPEACRLLGRTEADICQKGRDGVVDLTNPNLLFALEKRRQTGHFHGELTYKQGDGTVFPIELDSGIFTDSNGQTHAYNFFQNISARKKAEKVLYESEANIQAIFNASDDSIYLIAADETLLALNEIAIQRIGQPKEKLLGQKISDILPSGVIARRRPFVDHALQTGESLKFEDERNGNWMLNHLYPILDIDGKVIRLAIYSRDITERKLAEEALLYRKQQYDDLVAKIPVGVYILHTKPDGAFALDYASPRMAQMLNLSVESLLDDNSTIFKAIHPDDLDGFRTSNQDGIVKHQPFNWKGRIVAEGNVKWMHFRSTPEPLENGDMLWHGLIVDITEQVMAEQEISLKNEELSTLIAEKDKFFSILAHDLRSPFTAILGFSQILEEDLPTMEFDQIKRISSVLRNSAFSAFSLLENLLEWSLMKRGSTNYKPEAFLLRPKIEESLRSVVELARKKWIDFNVNIPEDLLVMADQNMMGSIIRNLASNAIKFTPKYGDIWFSARINDDQNIEISVKDSGIGMNQKIMDNLFCNDEHINRKGTEGEISSGLGLIICKEFVVKHGGLIWAESEEGKGSTFYFTLPAK